MNKQNVIWIVSYPKEGNRWMSSILRKAGAKSGIPPEGIMSFQKLKASGKAPEGCPAVSAAFTKRGPCAVLGTNAAHVAGKKLLHGMPGFSLATAGFIHVYRNPLDVLLSYIDFTRNEYKRNADNQEYKDGLFTDLLGFDKHPSPEEWGAMDLASIPQANLDHALQKFSDSGLRLPNLAGTWSEHVQSWLEAAKSVPGVNLRYEDCVGNPERLAGITKFFRVSDDDIRKAVRKRDGKARAAAGSEEPTRKPDETSKPYVFAGYFSRQAVDKFLAGNEETLSRFGYGDLASHM